MNMRNMLLLLMSWCLLIACGGGGGSGSLHIKISHSGTGLTCEASLISLELHDENHNLVNTTSAETLTITTSPAVETITPSSITVPSGNSTASFYISQTSALGPIDIDVVGDDARDLDDGGNEDESITFQNTAFKFINNIGTQVAGTSSGSLSLQAIRTDDDTKACTGAISGTTPVEIAYECNNPGTCTASDLLSLSGADTQTISRNNSGSVSNYQTVQMAFDGNGIAPFSFNFSDAGNIRLYAKKSVAASSPEPAFTLLGNSNTFWVKPSAFEVKATTLGGVDLNATSADDVANPNAIQKVDGAFNFTVSAVNSQGTVTKNYSPGQVQLMVTRAEPTLAGTVEGDLEYTSLNSIASALASAPPAFSNVVLENFVDGVSNYAGARYSEVGRILVEAKDTNYGGANLSFASASSSIGRFIPDHFVLSTAVSEDGKLGQFGNACSGYSYVGQAFSYASGEEPKIAVIPKDSGGATLNNYVDVYNKLTDTSMVMQTTPLLTSGVAGLDSTNLLVSASYQTPSISNGTGAKASYRYLTLDAADSFTFTRNANALLSPFLVNLPLLISSVTDADGVVAFDGGAAITSSAPYSFTPSSSGAYQRFGRLRLDNAFGPETAPLALPVNTEYQTADGFIVNTSDNCTDLVAGNFDLSVQGGANPDPGILTNIAFASSTVDATIANSPFLQGSGNLNFTAPGAGLMGSIDVAIVGIAGSYPWLLYDWDGVDQSSDGDLLDDLPSSTATFGRFRGHDRIIYWREGSN